MLRITRHSYLFYAEVYMAKGEHWHQKTRKRFFNKEGVPLVKILPILPLKVGTSVINYILIRVRD
jgi:hypothetical protein